MKLAELVDFLLLLEELNLRRSSALHIHASRMRSIFGLYPGYSDIPSEITRLVITADTAVGDISVMTDDVAESIIFSQHFGQDFHQVRADSIALSDKSRELMDRALALARKDKGEKS